MEYKTLNNLGIKSFYDVVDWRHPRKEDFKSNVLKGKTFRIGRKLSKATTYLYTCLESDWVSNKKPAVITYKNGNIDASTTFFKLKTKKQKSKLQIKQEILNKYPNSKLDIPKTGCQLHGDIDATLTLSNGKQFTIPWNY
jgi:hypothetical protein